MHHVNEAPDRRHRVGHAPPPTAPRLLRRQRDLPLPRPGLRGAAVRPRRRPRRRVAADRLRRARVRALAPPVAAVGAPRPLRPDAAAPVGRRPRGHELLLLRRHRPAAARHRRGDRVPPRDRARRARRAHAAATPWRSRSRCRASTCSPACASRASRSASRSRSPTPALFALYIVLAHRAARHPAITGIDGLGAVDADRGRRGHPDRRLGRRPRAHRPGGDPRRDRRRHLARR